MSVAKLYPGAIDHESIRGLVLISGPETPMVTLSPPGNAPQLHRIAISSELRAQLQPHGIVPWRFRIDGLVPGVRYELRVEPGLGRTARFTCLDPNTDALKIALASCYYGWLNRGWNYLNMLRSEYCRDVAFKLLVGDNLYADVHPRQRDSALDGGYLETVWLYLQYWFYRQDYAEVLGSGPTLTTWDDHEFWNNYPSNQFWLNRTRRSRRIEYENAARECIRVFQASLNPEGSLQHEPGVSIDSLSYRFEAAPVSFFVADLRTRRQNPGRDGWLLPPAELEALDRWARKLERPGVLVLGQPLLIEDGDYFDHNPPAYGAQNAAIWAALEAAAYDVLVLSGDVHHSRVLELSSPRSRRIWEIVSSPACHIPPVAVLQIAHDYKAQDQTKVSFPRKVTMPTSGHALVVRCPFATDAPNSIATVTFRKKQDGVEVGCAFLDLDRKTIATPVRSPCGPPETTRCEHPALFTLRARQG